MGGNFVVFFVDCYMLCVLLFIVLILLLASVLNTRFYMHIQALSFTLLIVFTDWKKESDKVSDGVVHCGRSSECSTENKMKTQSLFSSYFCCIKNVLCVK